MSDHKNSKQKIALAGTALIVVGGLSFYFFKGHGDSPIHRDTASVGSNAASGANPSANGDVSSNAGGGGGANGSSAANGAATDSSGGVANSNGNSAGGNGAGAIGANGAPSAVGAGGTSIAMIDKNAVNGASPDATGATRTLSGGIPGSSPHAIGVDGKPLDPKLALAPAKPVEPDPACYTVTYTHKALAGHKNMDECSQHRNLIKLSDSRVNQKSVCVRVDGTPVKFDWVKSSILLGPVAGPNTKISVRYCQPKAKDTCADDCKLPKDEFMAALGGDEEKIAKHQAKGGKVAKWDPTDAQEDSDVAAQVDSEMQKELADGIDLATFDGWKDSTPAASCSRNVASAPAVPGQVASARK